MEITPLDIDDLQGSGQGRSYTCSFCRRGFSNAQALGGHMNIHRRDRARLKQASEDLSLDLCTGPAGPSDDHLQDKISRDKTSTTSSNKTAYSSGGDEASSSVKRAVADHVDSAHHQVSPRREEGTQEISRLPLSLDVKIGKEKMQLSDGGGHSSPGQPGLVDLELRLGPEPHDTSSTNIA